MTMRMQAKGDCNGRKHYGQMSPGIGLAWAIGMACTRSGQDRLDTSGPCLNAVSGAIRQEKG